MTYSLQTTVNYSKYTGVGPSFDFMLMWGSLRLTPTSRGHLEPSSSLVHTGVLSYQVY